MDQNYILVQQKLPKTSGEVSENYHSTKPYNIHNTKREIKWFPSLFNFSDFDFQFREICKDMLWD